MSRHPGLHPPARLAIRLGGRPLAAELAARVTLCLVRQALGSPAAAELDLMDPPRGALDGVAHGAGLDIALADGRVLFAGRIGAIEYERDGAGGATLRLRAWDALQPARQSRRVRVLEKVSPGSLARDIAAGLGLPCHAAEDGPERARLVQRGESDLALLVAFAGEAGLHPVLRDGTLLLAGLDGHGAPVRLAPGAGLLRVRLSAGNERALARAEASGWDPRTLRLWRGTAATARQDAEEMQETGLFALPTPPVQPLPGRVFETAAEAEAAAQAALDTATALAATASGLAEGDPAIAPGRPLLIEDTFSPVAEGRHVVTVALHRIDAAAGYVTEFDTTPPARPAAPGIPAVLAGTVTDAADPDGQGRCRVALDALEAAETGWLPVLSPGAGAGKGLAALPERGDRVLLLFPDGAADRGVVLGGLWGEAALPRGAGARRGRPFVLRTAGGQTLVLGERNGSARLETASGSRLDLAPGLVRLTAAGDLTLEAPGRTLTLRARAIEMEQG
jgi:phage protein D/phage baseplate assembly protein gpV